LVPLGATGQSKKVQAKNPQATPKKGGLIFFEMTDRLIELSFDIDRLRSRIAAMSPLELEVFHERIRKGESSALDIVIADDMPAIHASAPDQVVISLHLA